MGFFADAMKIIENKRADRDNRRRGAEDMKQREVEALERIASAVTSTERK